jgi:hypothetical protein
MKNFRKIAIVLFGVFALMTLNSCSEDDDEERVDAPNVPSSYDGRPVDVLGTINVSSKNVTFNVWDSGVVDGDIITLIVNGKKVITQYTLTGSKKSIQVTLDNLGYNYVMLFAHNEGSLTPNTAALSVVDENGVENELTLSADLDTNGAYNCIVN